MSSGSQAQSGTRSGRLHGAWNAAQIVTGRTNSVDRAALRMKKPKLRPQRLNQAAP